MKQLKLGIFTLSLVAILSACSSNPSGDGKKTDKNGFALIDPTDTSMLTENCKAYVDAMREQEESIAEPYKYSDLNGADGVNIDEANNKRGIKEEDRQFLDKGEVEGQNRTVNGATPNRSDRNEGVKLEFELPDGLNDATVLVSENEDFSNARTYETSENYVKAVNLFVNTKYYWKVKAGDKESEVKEFVTGDYPRWISARPLYNVRDNGGYMTYSGKRVKQGLVFRGGEITNRSWGSDHILTNAESSKKAFREEMKIGVELDLRGASDIGDGYNACAFAENGDIEYKQYAIKSYEQTFTNTRSMVAPIFEILKEADQKPVYYHCFGGADRTGTIGFLLNGLLGVSYTDLVIDFELTSYSSINNEHIRCHIDGYQHNYDRWPALINQLKTDKTGGYAYDENALLMDNIENFLVKACSVPQSTIDTIRDIMLED